MPPPGGTNGNSTPQLKQLRPISRSPRPRAAPVERRVGRRGGPSGGLGPTPQHPARLSWSNIPRCDPHGPDAHAAWVYSNGKISPRGDGDAVPFWVGLRMLRRQCMPVLTSAWQPQHAGFGGLTGGPIAA